MKKKALKIPASLLVLLVLLVIVTGPVALVFPAYLLFTFHFYVLHPLISHPLVVAGALLVCALGGIALSRWPVAKLRYAILPAVVMGLVTTWLPPRACGFDPLIANTFAETVVFVGAAGLAYGVKDYSARVFAVLSLYCGLAVGLHIHVGLCHDDFSPDAGLIAVSSRSGVWLAVLVAIVLGWLSAWFGNWIYRRKLGAGTTLLLVALLSFSTALGGPAHEASSSGDIEALRMLVEGGTSADDRDTVGRTPLHLASSREIAELLIIHGADVNARDNGDATPLHYVNDPDTVALLLVHGANVRARNVISNTPLHEAGNDSAQVAELLLAHGADVNARGHSRDTPLHRVQSIDAAELLVTSGADIDARDEFGTTPLHHADEGAIVDLLVEHGADVDAGDNEGQTPLHRAVGWYSEFDRISVIERLVANGATVDARDNHDRTPLHHARDREVAEVLIGAGADVNALDDTRSKPWDIAKRRGYDSLTQVLSEAGGHGRKPVRDIVVPVIGSGLATTLLVLIFLRFRRTHGHL
jgi:ankyrin repeat protein